MPDHPLSPWAGDGEGSSRPRRVEDGKLELAEKSGLKKLVLTPEQKTWLLDWNDSNLENLHLETGARLSPKRALKWYRRPCAETCPPLLLPRAEKESLPAQRQSQEKMRAPANGLLGSEARPHPSSTEAYSRTAIRRSLLSRSSHNPDGGSEGLGQAESKILFYQPTSRYSPFSFRKSSSSKDSTSHPLQETCVSASAFFSLGLTARGCPALSPEPSNAHPQFAQPAIQGVSCMCAPTLWQDRRCPHTPGESEFAGDSPRCFQGSQERTSLFSSFRLKDKSFESSLQESGPRKDSQNLFSSPKGEGAAHGNAQPPEEAGAASFR